jgi:haloalkane dehalogenase
MSADSNLKSEPRPAWRAEYPFASNFFSLGKHQLHYVDEAPDSSVGGPVLFCHGNPTWSFYYRNLISAVSKSRRAIAIDNIGCGLSDKPAGYDYCLQNHIDNACQLVDDLDLWNVTLVAHDWGGAIGVGALQGRPERFKRIVLFNTAAFPPPYCPFRIRACRWPIVGKIGLQGFNLFAKAAVTMATERKGGLPETIAQGMLAPYDNWANRVATYGFVKDIPLSKGHKTYAVLERMESRLKEFADWPIMLAWGMKDWCFRPECLERFESHWPKAEVHRFAEAGHYVVEDAKDQVVEKLINFLDRYDSGSHA